MERRLETGDELAREDTPEDLDGKEEGSARGDPARVIRRPSSGGDDAVDMRMMLQRLVPGMEHAEEAHVRTEGSWVACDLEQCGRACAEE